MALMDCTSACVSRVSLRCMWARASVGRTVMLMALSISLHTSSMAAGESGGNKRAEA